MFKSIIDWFKSMSKVTMPEPAYREEPIVVEQKKVRKPRLPKKKEEVKPLVETVIPEKKKTKKAKK